jgi:uncharacterized membrane protein
VPSSWIQTILHDAGLDEEGFEDKVVVDRLTRPGPLAGKRTADENVLSRGTPNVLDLLIALFAAAAATFAMARPSIVGTIAGVAIATALMPPVCAIGISLANGNVTSFHHPTRTS